MFAGACLSPANGVEQGAETRPCMDRYGSFGIGQSYSPRYVTRGYTFRCESDILPLNIGVCRYLKKFDIRKKVELLMVERCKFFLPKKVKETVLII